MGADNINNLFYETLMVNCHLINFSDQLTNDFIQKKFVSRQWCKEELLNYFDKNFTDIKINLSMSENVINLVNDKDFEEYSSNKFQNHSIKAQWIDISIYTLEGRINQNNKDIDVQFRFIAPNKAKMKELVKRVNVNSLKKIYITHIEKDEDCLLHG